MTIPYKYKFVLTIITLEIIFFGFIIFFNYSNTNKLSQDILNEKRTINSSLLINLVKTPLLVFDFATLDNILAEFGKNKGVVGVKITTNNNKMISESINDKNIFSHIMKEYKNPEESFTHNQIHFVDIFKINEDDTILATVMIVYDIQNTKDKITSNLNFILLIAIIGILISTIVAYLIGTKIMNSLTKLKQAAEQISTDENKKIDINIKSNDEFEYLANSFKSMQLNLILRNANIKAQSNQLILLNEKLEGKVTKAVEENRQKDQLLSHQSKLAAMGEMIGNIAHQWRQPLNALAANIQFLKEDYEDELIDDEFLDDFIEKNMKTIYFMSKTIDNFRDFFKTSKLKEDFKILKCIDKPINIIKPQLDVIGIDLDISGDDFTVNAIEGEFQQVILNIINNAKDAIVENEIKNGKIELETKIKDNKGIITIQDNAGGIPSDSIDRIFEPYYTTKEQGKGTGIGLYMSKMIVANNMEGLLNVSNVNNGARFEIILNILDI